jgi:hypothetical protein
VLRLFRAHPSAAALIAVATVAVLAFVSCGDPDSTEPESVVAYEPKGEVARLRIEAVDAQFGCDGATHEVRIWLDDLPRRAVAPQGVRDPDRNGLASFLFRLRFDPSVVWVREQQDVRINPDLGDAAPATTVPRNFTAAPVRIDNNDGTVLVGAIALGLAVEVDDAALAPGATKLPAVTGIDPYAGSEPILLATVQLTAVGEGESALELAPPPVLEDVELLTDNGLNYFDADLISSNVEVKGPCAPFDTATPLVTTTPTPAPFATPPPEPTPVVLIPTPAAGIRGDCPSESAVLDDSDFSICYSAQWVARASTTIMPSPGRSYVLSHSTVDIYVGLAVVDVTPMSSGAVDDLADLCAQLAQAGGIEVLVETMQVAGGEIEACVGHGDRGLGGFDPIEAYAPLRNGRFLQITAFHGENSDSGFTATRELIATLKVK